MVQGVGKQSGMNGFDSPKHTAQYWSHLYMALVVIIWVCHVVGFDICSYTKVRHRRLLSVERYKMCVYYYCGY